MIFVQRCKPNLRSVLLALVCLLSPAALADPLGTLVSPVPPGLETVEVDGVSQAGGVTTGTFNLDGVNYTLATFADGPATLLLITSDASLALEDFLPGLPAPLQGLSFTSPVFIYSTMGSGTVVLPAALESTFGLAGPIEYSSDLVISTSVTLDAGSEAGGLFSSLNLPLLDLQLGGTLPADLFDLAKWRDAASAPALALDLEIDVPALNLGGLTSEPGILSLVVSDGAATVAIETALEISIGVTTIAVPDVRITRTGVDTRIDATLENPGIVFPLPELQLTSLTLSGTPGASLNVVSLLDLSGSPLTVTQSSSPASDNTGIEGQLAFTDLAALIGLADLPLVLLEDLSASNISLSKNNLAADLTDDTSGDSYSVGLFRQDGETLWNIGLLGAQPLTLGALFSDLGGAFDAIGIADPAVIYVPTGNSVDGLDLPAAFANTAAPAGNGASVGGSSDVDETSETGSLLNAAGLPLSGIPLSVDLPADFFAAADDPDLPTPEVTMVLDFPGTTTIAGLSASDAVLTLSNVSGVQLETDLALSVEGTELLIEDVLLARSGQATTVAGTVLPNNLTFPLGGFAVNSISIAGTMPDSGPLDLLITSELQRNDDVFVATLFKNAGDTDYSVNITSNVGVGLASFVEAFEGTTFDDLNIENLSLSYVPASSGGGGLSLSGDALLSGDLLADVQNTLSAAGISQSVIDSVSQLPLAATLPSSFLENPVTLPDMEFEFALAEPIVFPGDPDFITTANNRILLGIRDGGAIVGLLADVTVDTGPGASQTYRSSIVVNSGTFIVKGQSFDTWDDAFGVDGLQILAPEIELVLGTQSSLAFNGDTNLLPGLSVDVSVSLVKAQGTTKLGDSRIGLLGADLSLAQIPGLGADLSALEALLQNPVFRDIQISGGGGGDKAFAGSISLNGGEFVHSLMFQVDGKWNTAFFRTDPDGVLLSSLVEGIPAGSPLDDVKFDRVATVTSSGFRKNLDQLPVIAQDEFGSLYGNSGDSGNSGSSTLRLPKGLGLVASFDPSQYSSGTLHDVLTTLSITDVMTFSGAIGSGLVELGAGLPNLVIPPVIGDLIYSQTVQALVPIPQALETSFFLSLQSGQAPAVGLGLGALIDMDMDGDGNEAPLPMDATVYVEMPALALGMSGESLQTWPDAMGIKGLNLEPGTELEYQISTLPPGFDVLIKGQARLADRLFTVQGGGGVFAGLPSAGLGGSIEGDLTLAEIVDLAGDIAGESIDADFPNATIRNPSIGFATPGTALEAFNLDASGGISIGGELFAVRSTPAIGSFQGTIQLTGLTATGEIQELQIGPVMVGRDQIPSTLDISATIDPFNLPYFRVSGDLSFDNGGTWTDGFVDLSFTRLAFELNQEFGTTFKYGFGAFMQGPDGIDFNNVDLGFKGGLALGDIESWVKGEGLGFISDTFADLTQTAANNAAALTTAQNDVQSLNDDIEARKDVIDSQNKSRQELIDDARTGLAYWESQLSSNSSAISSQRSRIKRCNQTKTVCVGVSPFRVCSTVPDLTKIAQCEATNADASLKIAGLEADRLIMEGARIAAAEALNIAEDANGVLGYENDPEIIALTASRDLALATLSVLQDANAAAANLAASVTSGLEAFNQMADQFSLQYGELQGSLQGAVDGEALIMELKYTIAGKPYVSFLTFDPVTPLNTIAQLEFIALEIALEALNAGADAGPLMNEYIQQQFLLKRVEVGVSRDAVAAANGLELDESGGAPQIGGGDSGSDSGECVGEGCDDPAVPSRLTAAFYNTESALLDAVFGAGQAVQGQQYDRVLLGSIAGLALTDEGVPPANRSVVNSNVKPGVTFFVNRLDAPGTPIETARCRTVDVYNPHGLVYNDNEADWPDILSIGDINNHENDNLDLYFEDETAPRWFGVELFDNSTESGENVKIWRVGNDDQNSPDMIIDASAFARIDNATFLGFYADRPIGRIQFDEDSGGDDIGVRAIVVPGPAQDLDGDTLTDCYELAINTDPIDVNSDNDSKLDNEDDFPASAAAILDTDGDGKPDYWLDNCGLVCQQTSGLTLDTDDDNDGLSDTAELIAGTNPLLTDTDGDGIDDGTDTFPLLALDSVDTDQDGVPDECDVQCLTAGLFGDVDADGDGLIEIHDAEMLSNIRFSPAGTFLASADGNSSLGCGGARAGDEVFCLGYELSADIDFDADADGYLDNDLIWNDGAGWVPIGTEAEPFTASFEGNGRTISNLFVNRPSQDNVGLFGVVEGTTVSELNIAGALTSVRGNDYAGLLAGKVTGTTVTAVTARGFVSGRDALGGLVGEMTGGAINLSLAEADVFGRHTVGGLAGSLSDASVFQVYATGGIDGTDRVGGLFGEAATLDMDRFFSVSSVSGDSRAGGLVGEVSSSSFFYGYWRGSVLGGSEIGGLAGSASGLVAGAIYLTGPVTGSSKVGGVLGRTQDSRSDIRARVYWNTDEIEVGLGSDEVANTLFNSVGQTTAALQVAEFTGSIYTVGYSRSYWEFGVLAPTPAYPNLVFNGQSMRDVDFDGLPDYRDALPQDPSNGLMIVDMTASKDGDSIPDFWERQQFGSLLTVNDDSDYDGDLLLDREEYVLGTSPVLMDTDGDGDSDADEVLFGSDPLLFSESIDSLRPVTPTVVATSAPIPVSGYVFTASEFLDPNLVDGDYLSAASWEISVDDTFTSLLLARENIGASELANASLRLPFGLLAPGQQGLWARTRHRDRTDLWSLTWSPGSPFDVAAVDDNDLDANGVDDLNQIEAGVFADSNRNGIDDIEEQILPLIDPLNPYTVGAALSDGVLGHMAIRSSDSLPAGTFPVDQDAISLYAFSVTQLPVDTENPASVQLTFHYPWPFESGVDWVSYDAPVNSLDTFTPVSFDGNTVEITLVDGAETDFDGVVNGTIVHSGGPGISNIVFAIDSDGDGIDDLADSCPNVADHTPLAIVPGELEFEAEDADGAIVSLDDWVLGGCLDVTVTIDPDQEQFALGSTPVTLTAADSVDEVSESFVVTVVDTTAPELLVPVSVTAEADEFGGASVVFTDQLSATDLVDANPEINCLPASGSLFAIGTTPVLCTAIDSAGNPGTEQSLSVTVVDNVLPELQLPDDLSLEAESSEGAIATFVVSADDLVEGELAVTCSASSGDLFAPGETVVDCSAADSSGNIAAGSFTVTVTDSLAPVITVPEDLSLNADVAGGAVAEFVVEAQDAFDGDRAVSCSAASGSVFATGSTVVNCEATDSNGNVGTASFTVVVTDSVAPVLTMPVDLSQEANTLGGALINFEVSAVDVVDEEAVTISCSPLGSGELFSVGDTLVTCEASDASNNVSSASFTVTITDLSLPSLTVPSAVNEEAAALVGTTVSYAASATDIVDGDLDVTCSPAAGTSFALGETSVTCTATDSNGNKASASFPVTVVDSTPPQIVAPADVAVEATGPTTVVSLGQATAEDVFGVATILNNAPSRFALGTTPVQWTAVDGNGNPAVALQSVTVVDTRAPTLSVPANVTLLPGAATDPSATGAAQALDSVDTAPSVSYTDSVQPGAGLVLRIITRTWVASDASNNKATAVQVITIAEPDTIPVATITATPAAGSQPLQSSFTASVQSGNAPYQYEWRIADQVFNTPTASYVFVDQGVFTVTLTVTDRNGDTAIAETTVEVLGPTIQDYRDDISVIRAEMSRLKVESKARVAELKSDIQDMRDEIATRKSAFVDLRTQLQSEIDLLVAARKASSDDAERLDLADDIADKRGEILAASAEYRRQRVLLKDQISDKRRQVTVERADTRVRLHQLDLQVRALRNEILLLRPNLSDAKRAIDQEISLLQLEIKELGQIYAELADETSLTIRDHADEKRDISEARDLARNMKTDEIADENSDLRRTRDKAERLLIKARIADLKAERKAITDEAKQALAEIDSLIAAERSALAEAKSDRNATRDDRQAQIAALRATRKTL